MWFVSFTLVGIKKRIKNISKATDLIGIKTNNLIKSIRTEINHSGRKIDLNTPKQSKAKL